MSWGIKVTGTRDGAAREVAAQLDKVAAGYAGKPEADDILAAKARILALIAECELTKDAYTDWNAVDVEAGGSHSTSGAGIASANFSVRVVRTHLALAPADPPAPDPSAAPGASATSPS